MDYDTSYNCVGKERLYSEDCSWPPLSIGCVPSIFPLSETNEVRAETFIMATRMAKGDQMVVGVSSLAFFCGRLDVAADGKGALHAKSFTLSLAFLSWWLSCYCPETYNQKHAYLINLSPMVGIAGIKLTDCTFHYAFDLFRWVNHISDYPEFGLLEEMNCR